MGGFGSGRRGGGPTVESEFAFRIDIDALRRQHLGSRAIRAQRKANVQLRDHPRAQSRSRFRNRARGFVVLTQHLLEGITIDRWRRFMTGE
jgi:hypothetical protein